MVNLDRTFGIDKALASVTSLGDTNTYNYGQFNEGVDYRKLGFKGFSNGGYEFMYKHWDILDDTTYFGAHAGNANITSGILIPEGQVETFDGGSVPYLTFKYRDGMDKQVGRDGAVFGLGHNDVAEISYTTEATLCGANIKDFIHFEG